MKIKFQIPILRQYFNDLKEFREAAAELVNCTDCKEKCKMVYWTTPSGRQRSFLLCMDTSEPGVVRFW